MRSCCAAGLLVLVGLCASIPLVAKGPTGRIEIEGAGLVRPIELTDPALLSRFQVWSGAGAGVTSEDVQRGFIVDWTAAVAVPRGLARYKVSFFARYANRPVDTQDPHLAYVVWYEPDVASGRGYVYLPGKGEPFFQLNAATIFRDREGQWFRATSEWDAAVMDLLRRR